MSAGPAWNVQAGLPIGLIAIAVGCFRLKVFHDNNNRLTDEPRT